MLKGRAAGLSIGAAIAIAVLIAVLLWQGSGAWLGSEVGEQAEPADRQAEPGAAQVDRVELSEAVSIRSRDPLTTVHSDTVPACGECEIRLEPVGEFGRLTDSILLRHIPAVERDSRGRFYATVRNRDHELIVYGPDGEILGTVGGSGSGPGEFQHYISDLRVGPGDSLWVAHDAAMISVFDPEGELARTFRVEHPLPIAEIVGLHPDGNATLHGEQRDPARSSFPLHHFDGDGRHRASFGTPDLLLEYYEALGRRSPPQRTTAQDRGGGLWLAERGNYRLEKVAPDGEVLRVIGVEGPPDWLTSLRMTSREAEEYLEVRRQGVLEEAQEVPSLPSDVRAPRTPWSLMIWGIASLGDGLLAVTAHVPATNWQDARGTVDTTRFRAEPQLFPGYRQQLHDTVLDVLDVESGAVIARKRVPSTGYLTSDGAFYVPAVTEEGLIQVRGYEIRLDVPDRIR